MNYKEAIYITADDNFVLRNYDAGNRPSEYHAKIKVKWIGICGSDLHSIETKLLPELALGHEWIGEVTEVGSKVNSIKPGDFVTSTIQITCGYCRACIDKIEPCENQYSLAVNKGMIREVAFLPEKSLVKVPGPVSASSTLYEILAVAENVFLKTKDRLHEKDTILIMGAGLLGLSVGLVLNREGFNPIMVETIPSRIKRANDLGIKCLHLGDTLLDKSFNDSFSFIFDATGDHLGGKGGWRYLEHFGKKNFKAIVLAKYLNNLDLKTHRLFSKQATLEWIQGCTEESLKLSIEKWQSALEELAKTLISHIYDISEVNEAFLTAKNRKESARVIIKI